MIVKVTYLTKTFPVENQNQVGKIAEISFNSLEEAKSVSFPIGCVSAYIPIEDGIWFYSATLGWEFYKKGLQV